MANKQYYIIVQYTDNQVLKTRQQGPYASKSEAEAVTGFISHVTNSGGGGGGGDASKQQVAGMDIASAAIGVMKSTVEFAKNAYAAMETGFKNIDKSGILDPMNAMQDIFGMSNDAYAKMTDASNEFVDGELKKFIEIDNAYIRQESILKDSFKHDEVKEAYGQLIVEMTNMNTMALKSFDQGERERALLVQKNLKLTSQETTKLLQRTYAETGDTSSDILTNIAAHAEKIAQVTGMSTKDIANEMAQILSDTETFGFMSEESAARMAGTYKQLGLDLNAVKGIINGFRSFDQAAQKMGDLSAMFGIQMDAMEMMALANEDEEAFLTKMRDDMMDQGVDVENMSKTRLRALGDQMNMTQEQVQTFFRTGEMQADQAEMEAASADANKQSIEDTVKSVKEMKRYVKLTKDEIIALGSAKSMITLRQRMGATAIEGDKFNSALRKIVPESETATQGMGIMLDNMGKLTKKFRKEMQADGGAESIYGGVMGITAGDMMGPFKEAVGKQATEGGKETGLKFSEALGAYIKPKSLPPAWEGLKTGIQWIKANAGNDSADLGRPMKEASAAVGQAFGSGIESAIAESMANIGKMITDAVNAAGPLDVDVNTNVTAQVAAAAEVQAPPTVTQIDSASLAAELSGLGLAEVAETIGQLPEGISTALSTMTIENQAAAQVEAAAVTAETLSVENSPAFQALAESLATMTEEQKTALTAISDAIKSESTMYVDLYLQNDKIASAMKQYEFGGGQRFQIAMPS